LFPGFRKEKWAASGNANGTVIGRSRRCG